MTAQKIYLIRHGQTDYNLQGIVQGCGVDSSLNNTGRAQALSFFQTYRDVPFDRVYASALRRSQETVQPFVDHGKKLEKSEALNEISWGTKEGQRITPDEDAYYHWILTQWQQGNTHLPIEGGESPDDVARRQKPFLEMLRARYDDKTVLICMHGRAMRILLCQFLNYPLRSMDMFDHENLCLYVLGFNGLHYRVEQYNQTDHLRNFRSEVRTSVILPK